jgi:hypothetical protein
VAVTPSATLGAEYNAKLRQQAFADQAVGQTRANLRALSAQGEYQQDCMNDLGWSFKKFK